MSTLFLRRVTGLLVLCAVVTWCGASFDASTVRAIDEVIEAGMNCKDFPGLAVAVVKNGEILLSKGYGVKDRDTQAPVTSDTVFQIASVTKAFTAAVLSTVLAENNLRVTQSLRSTHALPDDFRFNNSLRTTYSTSEDLLAHRTGVPRNNYLRLSADYSIAGIVDKVQYLPSVGPFRDSFYYNDLMYGLASRITEIVGQKQWQQQVRDIIFSPLGMTSSTFASDVDFDRDDVAYPYVLEHGQMRKASTEFVRHWGRNVGSGSIYSSANDMAKWAMMLLNHGTDVRGTRVLSDAVIDQVFKPSNVLPRSSYQDNYRRPVTPVTFSLDTYGLGWRMGYYREYKTILHSGSTFGYRSYLTLLPEMNVGVVAVMTGSDTQYKFRIALHEYLIDVALGYTPWINSSTICTFPDPWRSAYAAGSSSDEPDFAEDSDEIIPKPRRSAHDARIKPRVDLDLDLYTGTYHHGAYGDLTVEVNATRHSLQLTYGVGLWTLTSEDGVTFEGHWAKDYPTLDMDFTFQKQGQQVVAVEATDFDSSSPPMFFRKSEGSAESPVVG